LVVSPDAERRERAVAVLERAAKVVQADGISPALDEISLGQPMVALIDCELEHDAVTGLIGALGDLDRAVLWVSHVQPELLVYGALVQIPYSTDDGALVEAVNRLAAVQQIKEANARNSERVKRLDHVFEVVRNVRHEINGPLTAVMAETDLLLMDGDQLSQEQKKSLQTIGEMADRIGDLCTRLRELDTEGMS
jgi:signal transduction histidine kinase